MSLDLIRLQNKQQQANNLQAKFAQRPVGLNAVYQSRDGVTGLRRLTSVDGGELPPVKWLANTRPDTKPPLVVPRNGILPGYASQKNL